MTARYRLLSLRNDDGTETLGAVTPRGVVDVRAACARQQRQAPLTLDDLLQRGGGEALDSVVGQALADGTDLRDEAGIRHGQLFRRPGKIVCVGLNYRQHAKEVGMAEPRVPPLFSKFNNALAGHDAIVKLPPADIATKFDYETELLIVIGRHARNVPEEQARDYVAGYCTANDLSARDLQLELPSSQWLIGKTLDGFAPIGPWFVPAALAGDPDNLRVQTWVNGELRQSSSTSDFIFNTAQMVSYISRHFPLEPGDIIFTGTPQGVILGYPKDQQQWLKAGDHVVSAIENLGELHVRLA